MQIPTRLLGRRHRGRCRGPRSGATMCSMSVSLMVWNQVPVYGP